VQSELPDKEFLPRVAPYVAIRPRTIFSPPAEVSWSRYGPEDLRETRKAAGRFMVCATPAIRARPSNLRRDTLAHHVNESAKLDEVGCLTFSVGLPSKKRNDARDKM